MSSATEMAILRCFEGKYLNLDGGDCHLRYFHYLNEKDKSNFIRQQEEEAWKRACGQGWNLFKAHDVFILSKRRSKFSKLCWNIGEVLVSIC